MDFGVSSAVILVVIAVERYYSVVYPQVPNRKLTKRKVKVSYGINWSGEGDSSTALPTIPSR